MLVEGRLEPHGPKHAARQPIRRQRLHLGDHRPRVDIRRPEQLQRPGRAAPFGQGGALQHHRPGIGPRHRQVRGVGAGVDPRPFAQRPAEARPLVGRPALHLDHAVIDVQFEVIDEPQTQFAHRHAVPHRHRPGPHEALVSRLQRQPLDRPSRRIGPIQHPHRLSMFRRRLQHIEQRRDIGVDAAPQVLQIDQDDVERLHPFVPGPAHLPIQAEHRNAVDRIAIIRALHHIVLQVALHPVLRPEGGAQRDLGTGGQRIHGMGQLLGHRRRMRQQRDAPPFQGRPQRIFGQEAIEAEVHKGLLRLIATAMPEATTRHNSRPRLLRHPRPCA